MKIINFLFAMLFVTYLGFAQNAPIDFETGGYGASWTWNVFENDLNPALEFVANPSSTGINTSSTVAKFTALQTGQPWAGCESAHGTTDLGEFVLDASNSTIKIMVYKSVISDVGIKLVSSSGWAQTEIKVANTLVDEWEELTFDFSAYPNPPAEEGQYDQIVIFPDFNLDGRTQDNIIYFDNITFNAGTTVAEPTEAAPTPTHNSENVISLFSHAYTDVTVDTWRTDWSVAIYEEVEIEGNPTKKYSALDYVGIETVVNQIDITEMEYFHFDVWSPNFTSLGVKLVDFGADGAYGGGDDSEHQVNISTPAQEEWVSLNIPLSDFTGLTSKENIAQLVLVGQPTGSTTIYLDNVYFHNGASTPEGPTVAAPTPTQSANNVISMFSNAFTDVTVDTWRTDWSAAIYEEVEIEGNATKKYSNLDFVGIETVTNQIDISEMENFHLNVWSADFTFFGVKLVDFGADATYGGGDDTEHQVNFETPAQEEWVSLNIPLSDFTGLTSKQNIAQLVLVGQPTGTTTIFIDNVYFYKTGTNINDLANNQINIYPNPAVKGTHINLTEEVKQVEIFDLSGKKILTSNSTTVINTENLNAGVYIVKICSQDNKIKTQKLILN